MLQQKQLPYVYFNETIFQFIDDLKVVFKNDIFLTLVGKGLKMFVNKKPTALKLSFGKAFEQYFDKIEKCDEAFFLNHSVEEYKLDYKRVKVDIEKEISILKHETNYKKEKSIFMKMVLFMKDHWMDLSPENKKVIWEYMNQLVSLYKLCE